VAVIVVVLVLALGGGAWFVFGPSEDDDGGGDRSVAVDPNTPGGQMWAVNEDGVEDGDRPTGFWPVGDTIVKATGNVFTAYAVADGSEAWSLELEEGTAVCVPATTTEDGLIVVGHGEHNCGENITQIDLTTGETGWSRPLEPEENPLSFHIAISGSSYAVQTLGGWNLHRVEDGEPISTAAAMYDALGQSVNDTDYAREQQLATGQEVCAVDALVGGELLIRRRTCATVTDPATGAVSAPFSRLENIDPTTGDTVWSLDLPEGRWLSKINSTSPLIVTLRDQEFGGELELAFIDEAGQITGQVPIENIGLGADDTAAYSEQVCRGDTVVYSPVDDCEGMAVHGDRLYASPSTIFSDPIVTALNATTGEVEWSYEATEFSAQVVLDADEDGVIVHQAGFDGEPGQIARISADGQQVEPLFRTDDLYLPGNSFVDFRDGRLVTSPPDYSLDQDLAAYGPDGGGGGNGGNGNASK
jgi:outer membrane protein assembly factor BamB